MTALQFDQVSKVFPGVRALDAVSFTVTGGRVHGLLGENGAGKSTLLKILGGQYRPDEGRLVLNDDVCDFPCAGDAIAKGIAVIHQELQTVPGLSVMENLLLGRLPRRWGLLDKRAARDQVRTRLQALGVELDPDQLLQDCSIAQRQMVEICKAVMQDAQVIAFDEPTSSLSHRESVILFQMIRDLRAQGKVILYISHRLEELYALCDDCTILRDGQHVATHTPMATIPQDQLIAEMVGRTLSDIYDYQARTLGAPRLHLHQLAGAALGKSAKPVDLQVRAGEIVGFFGLVGAGRSELMRMIMGADARSPASGVVVDGQILAARDIPAAIVAGVVMCPEDRKEQGILATASVAENINISSRRGRVFLRHAEEARRADDLIAKLRIKTPSLEQPMNLLSGGNQQKVILARWLAQENLKVFILDEPTRGIDVGARHEIYRIMYEVAEQGCAVLVVSSDLPEVLGVSDRIIVMREGEISGELLREDASEEAVLKLALLD